MRDENGMEPIPSFSSPVKPAMQSTGISQDMTNSVDDSMDIAESKPCLMKGVSICFFTKIILP